MRPLKNTLSLIKKLLMKDTENTLQQLLDKSFESFDLVQGL